MDNSSDHHHNITQLNPGTMYKVTVSVECQGHGLQNATVSINTTTSKFMEHIHVYTKLHYHFLLYMFIRNVSLCIRVCIYSSLSHLQTHRAPCLTFQFLCNAYSAVPPTIAEATNDTVDTHPMLTAGQVLTLTCSAMGTPRPQIDWYNGDSRITTSSRVQINKSEFGDSTLVSMLVISSVTVGDSGTYECWAENSAGSTSLQYQVVVSECVHRCVAVQLALSCLHCLFCMCG